MDAKTAKTLIDAVCAVTTDAMTLEIAEWVTMDLPGRKRAAEFLHHYLAGTGLPKYVNIADLFHADPGLKKIVVATIARDLAGGGPAIGMPAPYQNLSSRAVLGRTSGKVPLPQSAWANTPTAQDWRYAIGSLNLDWKLITRLPGAPKAEVELSFKNEYRWHPKAERISQCVHQAAENLKVKGDRDYWMYGQPHRIEVAY